LFVRPENIKIKVNKSIKINNKLSNKNNNNKLIEDKPKSELKLTKFQMHGRLYKD